MKWLSVVVIILVIITVAFMRFTIKEEERSNLMNFYLLNTKERVEQTLRNSYTTCLTIAMTINDQGEPENFEEVARELLKHNTEVDIIQLVPQGIIQYVYPLEGNEAALGYDILGKTISPSISIEAQKTKDENRVLFSGPLPLIQGGTGIVGRIPVTKNNKFWGFSAVVIKMSTFLEVTGISSWENEKYNVQFSKINPISGEEVFFIENNQRPDTCKHVKSDLTNEGWRLYIIEKNNTDFIYELFLEALFLLTILLFLLRAVNQFFKKSDSLEKTIIIQNQKIIENEKLFEAIFNEAAIGILKMDVKNQNILLANHHVCSMLGYDRDHLLNICFSELCLSEKSECDTSELQKIRDKKLKYFTSEKQFKHNNGSLIWVNLSVTGLTNVQNEVDHYLVIIENINERKIVEAKNEEIRKRYESLFHDSPVPMWEEDFSEIKSYLNTLQIKGFSKHEVENYFYDNLHILQNCIEKLKIIEVNRACLFLHDASSKEELLKNISTIFPESAIDAFVQQLVCIHFNELHFSSETTTLTLDGTLKYINFRWNVMRGYEDTYGRVIITTEDITENKNQETLIISSQEKISSLLNDIDGIVWECEGDDFKSVFVSEKVKAILGYSTQEWMADYNFWQNRIHPDENESIVKEFYKRCNKDENFTQEYRIKAKDDSYVWVRDYVSVTLKEDKVRSVRGIMVEITKFKEIQEDLSKSHEILFNQNKRLLNFSHIVSHNLRSHSSNILAISHLIEKTSCPDEKEEYYLMIKDVADQLNHTLGNLNQLTVGNPENEINKSQLSLYQAIEEAINNQKQVISNIDAVVQNTVTNDVVISFNDAYFESIVYNLLSNALKFRNPNKRCEVIFRAERIKNAIILEIEDNGLGINLEGNKKDKLFNMHRVFHRTISSSGLGLFMVKNQMEAMGGTIDVETKVGIGTKFILTFSL